MKKRVRLLAMILTMVMVFSMLPPVEVWAEDYIISIHTAEEFMAIPNNPRGSYRLENSIHLGEIAPLGTFSGSLDGNNHTVTYSMRYSSGCKRYGLFSYLNNAHISDLNVKGSIDLDIPDSGEFFVGVLAGRVSGGSLGGGTISGSLDISGEAGSVVAGGVAGDNSNYYMNNVTVSVDASAKTGGSQYCSYYGTMPGGGSPNGCFIYGSTDLQGAIYNVTILSGGNDNTVDQNVTVESTKGASIIGIGGGERNQFYGNFDLKGTSGTAIILSGGSGQKYEGNVVTDGVPVCIAQNVRGAEVTGNVTAVNCGVTGLRNCKNSTMTGNITVNSSSGGSATGLSECTESIFNGNITVAGVNFCSVNGATEGKHVQVNGVLQLSQKSCEEGHYSGGVYGLKSCTDSGFTGSIRASGFVVYGYGASGDYNVVSADITVNSQSQSSAVGVTTNSSFEGSISNPTGSVVACAENSIAKGTLSGNSVTATGANSYFSGTITAKYGGGNNQASASIGYAADATVTVQGGENGASFNMGSYFGGSASISADDGCVSASCHYGTNVPMSHKASGVYSDSSTVLGEREYNGEVYWHRRAKDYGHEPNGCSGLIYFGWHTYWHRCYDTVLGVGYEDADITDLSSVQWKNGIDPVNGTYKPEKDPVDYVLKVTAEGKELYTYRLSIGGTWYYPDSSGCISVEDGPAVISPLVIELKNGDASYTQVLRQSAYYPVPNMINTIQLEPTVEQMTVSLVAQGYPEQESGMTWGGVQVNLFGKDVDLFKNPMELSLSEFGGSIVYKNERLDNGNPAFTVSLGVDGDGLSAKDLTKNPRLIAEKLEKAGKMMKITNGRLKNFVKVAGVNMGINAFGYAEVALNPTTNTWQVVNGKLGVNANGGQRVTYHIPQTAYIVYVTAAYDLSGGRILNLKSVAKDDSVESVAMEVSGPFDVTGSAEAAIGTGYRFGDIYAEGGGRGALDISWELPHMTALENLQIDLRFSGFFESRFLWAGRTYSTPEGVFRLWPREEAGWQLLSEDQMEVLPRAYVNAGTAAVYSRSVDSIDTGDAVNISMLTGSSAYPYSEIQLLGLDDGRFVLIYTDDDVSRGAADRSTLRARIGTDVDGQIVWGDAITVESDGTGDYAFTACASNNEVAVVWQDMDQTFGSGEGVSMDEAAAHSNLTQAVLDCSGDVPQVLCTATLASGEGQLESMPMIFYVADPNGETLRTAWTTSTASNPIVADENTEYTLWLSEGFGGEGQPVQAGLPMVTGIALYGSELLWSTWVGDSSDLWLRDSAGNITRQREAGVQNLQGVGHRYIFTEGDNCMGGEWEFANCRLKSVSEANQNVLQLSSTGEVYYAVPGLESSTVYWLDGSVARPVGEYEGYLSSWDGAHGQIVALLRTGFEASDIASMTSQPLQDIQRLELEVACDNQQAVPGSFITMHVSAENTGTYDCEKPYVQVTMDDGTVLHEVTWNETLEAGSEKTLSFHFKVPADFTSQEVTVTVGPSSRRVYLGGTNLGVDAQWSSNRPGGVNVTVENTGNEAASGTVTLTDAAGEILAVQEVSLDQGSVHNLWMDFGKFYTEDTEMTVTLTEAENALNSADNQVTLAVQPAQPRTLVVSSAITMDVGEQKQIEVRAIPKGSVVSGLKFSSANPKIATVDSNGVVTAQSGGETTITVTAEDGTEYTTAVRMPINTDDMECRLVFTWLHDQDGAFFESEDVGEGMGMAPGNEMFVKFYVGTWNEAEGSWDLLAPIPADRLSCNEWLDVTLFRDREDLTAMPGQDPDYFCVISARENSWDQEGLVSYTMEDGTVLEMGIGIHRNEDGWYDSAILSNETYIQNFRVNPLEDENVFYFGFQSTYWKLGSVELIEGQDFVTLEPTEYDNLYKVTVKPEVAANIWDMGGFHVRVGIKVYNDDDPNAYDEQWWEPGIWVDADWDAQNSREAELTINGEDYLFFGDEVMKHYNTGEQDSDEWGNTWDIWKWEKADLPAGVSYEVSTNTLTLNNAELTDLTANYHWVDYENGNEGWKLPGQDLTVRLIGENSIVSDTDTALRFGDEVNACIVGDGSLYVKSTNRITQNEWGDYENYAAIGVYNGASLTIGGDARVTAEIAGEAYVGNNEWNEQAQLAAIDGGMNSLTLKDNAQLTTVIPEGGRISGSVPHPDDPYHFPGGYTGIRSVFALTVQDQAVLNTQSLHMDDLWMWDEESQMDVFVSGGTYYQTGGTVNITAQGNNGIADQWEWDEEQQTDVLVGTVEHHHYDGLSTNNGEICITGGELNISAPIPEAELAVSAYADLLAVRGNGQINISGGTVNLSAPTGCAVAVGDYGEDQCGSLTVDGGALNILGNFLEFKIGPWSAMTVEGGSVNLQQGEMKVLSIWEDETMITGGKLTVNGGSVNIENGFLRNEGHVELNGGTLTVQFQRNNQYMHPNEWFSVMESHGSLTVNGGELQVIGTDVNLVASIYGTYHQTDGGALFLSTVTDEWKNAYLEENGETPRDYAIEYYNNMTIDGGWLTGNAHYGITGYGGKLTLNDGSLAAVGQMNGMMLFGDTQVELNGGSLVAVSFGRETTMDNGDGTTVTFLGGNGIAMASSDASLIINGGKHKISGPHNENVLSSCGINNYGAKVELNGGTISMDADMVMLYNTDVQGNVFHVGDNMQMRSLIDGHVVDFVEYAYHPPVYDEDGNPVFSEDGKIVYDESITEYQYWIEEDGVFNGGEEELMNSSTQIVISEVKCGDNATWSYADGTLTIEGSGEMYDYTDETAPWYQLGKMIHKVQLSDEITAIGNYAFAGMEDLEISVGKNVKRIGTGALEKDQGVVLTTFHQTAADKYAEGSAITVNFIHEYTPATCTDPETCKYCDDSIGKALGHSWGNWTTVKEATVEAEGSQERVCKTCGEKETRKIEKLPDDEKPTDSTEPEETEPEEEEWVNPFVDVSEDKFYYEPVLWAYYNGITTGKDATHFNPSGFCTRSQVVTFLWRAAGQPEPESLHNPFPDVPEGKFYTKAVLWAVEQGITNGFKDGTFGPNASCTRGQIVTFLWRYFEQPEPNSLHNPFPDVTESKFYYKAVLWAVENGITGGFKDGTFGPDKTCTRDQIVTFLYRAMVE